MGALLSSIDRIKMDAFMRKKFKNFDYPVDEEITNTTIFDFYVTPAGTWEHWRNLVETYVYPETTTPEFSSIIVPIIDNARIEFLVGTIANQERAVLVIGEQGTAKTIMVKSFMKKQNPDTHMVRSFNFSSATSPYQFQKTIESYIDKRLGNTFGMNKH